LRSSLWMCRCLSRCNCDILDTFAWLVNLSNIWVIVNYCRGNLIYRFCTWISVVQESHESLMKVQVDHQSQSCRSCTNVMYKLYKSIEQSCKSHHIIHIWLCFCGSKHENPSALNWRV
jgi:hypothetical protein